MSYQEKKNILQLISATVVFGAYCWIVYLRFQDLKPEGVDLFQFWGASFLILIPVTMVVRMIIEIIFIIVIRMATKEDTPSFADELDKIIDLKAMRVSYFVFLLGFFLAMGSLTLQMTPTAMFIILLLSGFVSEAVGIMWRLYLYRKGV